MQYKQLHRRRCFKLIGLLLAGVLIVHQSSRVRGDDSDSWTAPPSASAKKNPLSPTPKLIAAGRDIYVQNCLQCHGDHGRGDGPAGRDLEPLPTNFADNQAQQESDGSFFWKITTGRKPMPAFRSSLEDGERWETVLYIRSLCGSKTKHP